MSFLMLTPLSSEDQHTSVPEEPAGLAASFSSSVDLETGTIYSVVSPQLSADARRGRPQHRRSTSVATAAAATVLCGEVTNHIAFRTGSQEQHGHGIRLDTQQPQQLVFSSQTLNSCHMARMARQTPAALDVATVPKTSPDLTKEQAGRKRTSSRSQENASRTEKPHVAAINTSTAALQGGGTGAGHLVTPTDSNPEANGTMAVAGSAKRQTSPAPPAGAPKEGNRQSPQPTFREGDAYLTGTWAGGYCASEETAANGGSTAQDEGVLRRARSQSPTQQSPSPRTSPSPAAMVSQSLPLLATAAIKIKQPPSSQHPPQKTQPPPPASLALATPPLTASVPHSADGSHQSLQMPAAAYAQSSTQKPPSPRSSSGSSDTPARAEIAVDGDADHQPDHLSDNGYAEAQSRPMSTILMVAATEENSGDAAQKAQQRESNWFRRQSKSNSLKRQPSDPAAPPGTQYEARMLRAQAQRDTAMAEAAELQRRVDELQRAGEAEIARLREEVAAAGRKLRAEYELRTAAEAKCSMMECELAELSSNIQYEAQNLVAQERRAHKSELERATRRHREVVQLMEMERAQVGALKLSLERETAARDAEHAEAERLRAALAAIEHHMSPVPPPQSASATERQSRSGSQSASSSATSPLECDAHIAGRVFFSCDTARPDSRLGEFLAFVDAASEKEALASAFMQRSLREDVEPTLAADATASTLPSLSGWSRHRRLLHSAQDATLELESYTPRVAVSRVVSPACYLCGCSVTRAAPHVPSDASARAHGVMFRMRLGADDADSKPLCARCHARMMAICSFFAYLRIVRRRLTRRPIADVWLEVNRARLHMWLVRSGASPDCQLRIERPA
ncbi:rab guanine nucleotide exchange factor S2 [Coemansia guatemalensis]|uniref:Rab guanine nucleotide exchange factor S2 n=1 Tax=Coemansia guatemalensis TaxID=2761395 RepID=A0A9W8I0Z4_9FUNG|nr:rab guanine nucleotide exchange factor S2 [Coemansia guatemalensis]